MLVITSMRAGPTALEVFAISISRNKPNKTENYSRPRYSYEHLINDLSFSPPDPHRCRFIQ